MNFQQLDHQIPEYSSKPDPVSSFLYASRDSAERTLVNVDDVAFGSAGQVVIAGPCAVESKDQVMETASFLADCGVKVIRGGSFKPRTSPYSFQGLGNDGVILLHDAARQYGLKIVTEVMDADSVAFVSDYADILQVGARNMQNTQLLKILGKQSKPVLLKRGFANTIHELLLSAEYILQGGNSRVILCERGIRTFEDATRFTFDVSAIPILQELTHLPVIADPSHAAGRKNIIPVLAKSAIAAGADGIMIEIHPHPEKALSDGGQALLFSEFKKLLQALRNIALVCERVIL